jgi:putative membrane protein
VSTDRAYDVGLQAERTALAWRRTALAVGLGAIVGARLTAPGAGGGAFVALAAGALLAVVVWVLSVRRYRAVHRALHERDDLVHVSLGTASAVLAAVATLTGVLAAAFVIVDR